jgi:hypothetical protein
MGKKAKTGDGMRLWGWGFLLTLVAPVLSVAALFVGVGKADITPPIGSPSAGYSARKGAGMTGIHDRLMAIALVIDNGQKRVAFCSVDHLGFTNEMVQQIVRKVQSEPTLETCEIFIGSSHTHSGGGGFVDLPILGKMLAGAYNKRLFQMYVDKTAQAIIDAGKNLGEGKLGVGYGHAEDLSRFCSEWPDQVSPLSDVCVIKVTKDDGSPLAVLFNYPMHPTVLNQDNREFSADFVGCAREELKTLLGKEIYPLFFNGAQGEIHPSIEDESDRFGTCASLGKSLAKTVSAIWNETEVKDEAEIATEKTSYAFKPQTKVLGFPLPFLSKYSTEINVLVLNKTEAFVTIPGELSCMYDAHLKEKGLELGYAHVSILGLVNDAHGYIIPPQAWDYKTRHTKLSFGGKKYGDLVISKAESLLEATKPAAQEGSGSN